MNPRSIFAVSTLALALAAVAPFAAAAGNAAPSGASAADHAGAHGHEAPVLTLDAGKKWATDEALRKGMTSIRNVVEPRLGDIHRGRLSADQYAKMASDVEAQVAYIVGNCKLAPSADAVLHAILADVAQGVEAMNGKQKDARPEQGVVQVVGALNNYGKYFNHPSWKPVHAGH